MTKLPAWCDWLAITFAFWAVFLLADVGLCLVSIIQQGDRVIALYRPGLPGKVNVITGSVVVVLAALAFIGRPRGVRP